MLATLFLTTIVHAGLELKRTVSCKRFQTVDAATISGRKMSPDDKFVLTLLN